MSSLFRLRDRLQSPSAMQRLMLCSHRSSPPLTNRSNPTLPQSYPPFSAATPLCSHRCHSSSRLFHHSAQPSSLGRVRSPSPSSVVSPLRVSTSSLPTSHSLSSSLTARLLLHRHASTSRKPTTDPISPNIASASASTASSTATHTPPAPHFHFTHPPPSSGPPTTSTNRRRLVQLTAVAAVVVSLALFTLNHTTALSPINSAAYEVYVAAYALLRVSRDVWTAALMVADYSWTLWGLEGEERRQRLEECHWRNADRLKRCFNANGGVYIKFGQHLAQMAYLVPDAYCDTMQTMLHQAPTSPFNEVQATIESALGRPIEEVFISLSPVPIASASLAQVHFGVLTSGEEVAVKVQHRFLKHTVASDIRAVKWIVKAVHWLAPAFDYNWLADEMSVSLPKECDFMIEAANADKARALFAGRDDLLIPRIYYQYSSPMVLVMERMRGVHVSDVKAIEAMDLQLSEVSTVVSEVFSEMMFVHGFVHADPHPGNVLVTRHPTHPSHPALVLLDHGLYSELTPSFRLLYAKLWRALITADTDAVKQYAQQCGAGELYGLFAAMLTRKPWSEVGRGRLVEVQGHGSVQREQLQEWAAMYGLEIQGLLSRIPKDMILLLKTNECLRHIESILGSDYSSVSIMARCCQQAINRARYDADPTWHTTLANVQETAGMEARVMVFEALMALHKVMRRLREYVWAVMNPNHSRLVRALKKRISRRRQLAYPASSTTAAGTI